MNTHSRKPVTKKTLVSIVSLHTGERHVFFPECQIDDKGKATIPVSTVEAMLKEAGITNEHLFAIGR